MNGKRILIGLLFVLVGLVFSLAFVSSEACALGDIYMHGLPCGGSRVIYINEGQQEVTFTVTIQDNCLGGPRESRLVARNALGHHTAQVEVHDGVDEYSIVVPGNGGYVTFFCKGSSGGGCVVHDEP